jgi:hypothetical protein
MTHTTDIIQLTILDENYESLHAVAYTGVILNKKEILKWLTYSIDDIYERKRFKDLVNRSFYIQEPFVNMSNEISRALF